MVLYLSQSPKSKNPHAAGIASGWHLAISKDYLDLPEQLSR